MSGNWVGISTAEALGIVCRDRTSKHAKRKCRNPAIVAACAARYTAIVLPWNFCLSPHESCPSKRSQVRLLYRFGPSSPLVLVMDNWGGRKNSEERGNGRRRRSCPRFARKRRLYTDGMNFINLLSCRWLELSLCFIRRISNQREARYDHRHRQKGKQWTQGAHTRDANPHYVWINKAFLLVHGILVFYGRVRRGGGDWQIGARNDWRSAKRPQTKLHEGFK